MTNKEELQQITERAQRICATYNNSNIYATEDLVWYIDGLKQCLALLEGIPGFDLACYRLHYEIGPLQKILDARYKLWGDGPAGGNVTATSSGTGGLGGEQGVAGDKCEFGNECGRAGCPECQQ